MVVRFMKKKKPAGIFFQFCKYYFLFSRFVSRNDNGYLFFKISLRLG